MTEQPTRYEFAPYDQMSPYRLYMVQFLLGVAGMGIGFACFSRATIRKIKERDGNQCVIGDECIGPLQAAHINHDKTDPGYNDPENGRMLCTWHHYCDHNRRPENGLTPRDNAKALNGLHNEVARQIELTYLLE